MKQEPELRFPEFSREWVKKRLEDIGNIVGGGTPDTDKAEFWNGNIIWLTPSEITDKKYIKDSLRKISELGLKKSSTKLLPKGTILITTRATVAEIAISKVECSTNQEFQSLIVKDDYYNEFIYYLLNRKSIKHKMLKMANGTTFLEINKTSLSKIKVYLPPTPKEQQKIASFLSSIDKKIDLTSQKLEKLKEYKRGLLQKMFV